MLPVCVSGSGKTKHKWAKYVSFYILFVNKYNQAIWIIKNKISVLDQSRSALTMTTSSGVGQLGANGNCANNRFWSKMGKKSVH